ncbi:hypothetical protein QJS10_CPB12g00532 [Acorus calamus]|uniref:Uncharacterized protein n=1 Tax=Acorus calamus TaxID=4465 RepID=A0AAV9DLU0_ACOCL|nr:hypothetical protein QJS10_CPB12g00532 [Acorus calamus]
MQRSPEFSSAFLPWLVGLDLLRTTAIFTSSGVHFVCPPDQAAIIRGLTYFVADAIYNVIIVHQKQTRLLEDVVLCDVLIGLRSAVEGNLKSIINVGCIGKEGMYETRSSMKVREMEIIRWDVTDALSKLLDETKKVGEEETVKRDNILYHRYNVLH